MKKYTNKILVVAGIALVLFFAITLFLTYNELEKQGKLTTREELGLSSDTQMADVIEEGFED